MKGLLRVEFILRYKPFLKNNNITESMYAATDTDN